MCFWEPQRGFSEPVSQYSSLIDFIIVNCGTTFYYASFSSATFALVKQEHVLSDV